MVNKALLDKNKILIGYSKKKNAKGIDVPDDCDLIPGEYRWDILSKSFIPIPKRKKIEGATDDDLYLVALALKSIRDGKEFPPICSKWLNDYFKLFDEKGKK